MQRRKDTPTTMLHTNAELTKMEEQNNWHAHVDGKIKWTWMLRNTCLSGLVCSMTRIRVWKIHSFEFHKQMHDANATLTAWTHNMFLSQTQHGHITSKPNNMWQQCSTKCKHQVLNNWQHGSAINGKSSTRPQLNHTSWHTTNGKLRKWALIAENAHSSGIGENPPSLGILGTCPHLRIDDCQLSWEDLLPEMCLQRWRCWSIANPNVGKKQWCCTVDKSFPTGSRWSGTKENAFGGANTSRTERILGGQVDDRGNKREKNYVAQEERIVLGGQSRWRDQSERCSGT